jgi:HEAT repeat protein
MGAHQATGALKEKLEDEKEHLYVRLEAAASLVRLGEDSCFKALEKFLANEYLETQLETVIILGEIRHAESARLLIKVLKDQGRHSEIRAGAAWAIGELRSQEGLSALIECFSTVETEIRIEAARALVKLARESKAPVLAGFSESRPEERAGIAWALGKAGNVEVTDLIDRLVDEDTRQWGAWVLGSQNSAKLADEIEQIKRKDPEVYFAITVLWKIISSWAYGLEEY